MIRENVLKALEIFEMLVRRERKKRDLLVREGKWMPALIDQGSTIASRPNPLSLRVSQFVATDLQQLQLKLRFEPRGRHDQVGAGWRL